MGCSPDHPAVAGQVARGWAGPSRQVVPVLVGSDTSDEFPAGSENPTALAVGSVNAFKSVCDAQSFSPDLGV